jgi:SanA protein
MKKKIMIVAIVLITVFCVSLLGMSYRVQSFGKKYIISMEELPQEFDAIIVLGAGVMSDGSPSAILADRLQTSVEVYNASLEGKFLLTGDHGRKEYNEVRAMKKYIAAREVEESEIFMDHAGFNTYDSMYRAKNIFGVEKAVIVTNEYHLPRALYIARKLGVEAYGVPSDKRQYYYMSSYRKREILAQVKAYVNVNLFKPLPKFLGESIPVNSSDGRITDDELK